MPTPELSIIIVNYNSGEYLSRTLKSILQHPPSVPWEVVVLDNASSDDSMENAKKTIRDSNSFNFMESSENLGFAGGNNKAISEASGQYLLLLNPDTEITTNALDRLLEYLRGNDDVGVAGSCLVDENGDYTVSFGWFPTARGILSGAFLPKRFQGPKSGGLGIIPDKSITEPMNVDYVCGASLMTTRKTWDDVGPLDDNYFAYFEETDWCLRVKSKGLRVVLIPDAVIHHFEGQSFTAIPYRKMEIFVKSAKRFFKLHYPPGLCTLYVTSNVIASTMKIIYLTLTGWITSSRRKRTAPVLSHHKAFLRALLR